MLSTSPDGSADKIQVFDFKMNYKLLSPSTISLYTPTFLSTMLQIVIVERNPFLSNYDIVDNILEGLREWTLMSCN